MSLGRILKTLVSWAIDNNQNAILFIYIIPFFSSEIPPYTTDGNHTRTDYLTPFWELEVEEPSKRNPWNPRTYLGLSTICRWSPNVQKPQCSISARLASARVTDDITYLPKACAYGGHRYFCGFGRQFVCV